MRLGSAHHTHPMSSQAKLRRSSATSIFFMSPCMYWVYSIVISTCAELLGIFWLRVWQEGPTSMRQVIFWQMYTSAFLRCQLSLSRPLNERDSREAQDLKRKFKTTSRENDVPAAEIYICRKPFQMFKLYFDTELWLIEKRNSYCN